MDPIRAVQWMARGVPGVYRAARAAGLGHLDACRVVAGSGHALVAARRRYPHQWRAENAVRHFVWQAWLTASYGRDVAAAVGSAHERLAPPTAAGAADSEVDQANNRIGQEYGATHAQRLRALGMRDAQTRLVRDGVRLWEAGQLRAATTGSGGGGSRFVR